MRETNKIKIGREIGTHSGVRIEMNSIHSMVSVCVCTQCKYHSALLEFLCVYDQIAS